MISCGDYDHIEIVCMYNYPVTLTLNSGLPVNGMAVDTRRNQDSEERIVLAVDGVERLIVLDKIVRLDVEISNPHFQTVLFE